MYHMLLPGFRDDAAGGVSECIFSNHGEVRTELLAGYGCATRSPVLTYAASGYQHGTKYWIAMCDILTDFIFTVDIVLNFLQV